MGLNTVHDKRKDTIKGIDLNNNEHFQCEMLDEIVKEKISLSVGFEIPKTSLMVKLNGNYNVLEHHKVQILGRKFEVIRKLEHFSNKLEFRKRDDIGSFTGDSILVLN